MARVCGPCTLCCLVPAVGALAKPANTPCRHQTDRGCTIYTDPARPSVCHAFRCRWLEGDFREDQRPDLIGGFVTMTPDRMAMVVHEDLRDPGARKSLASDIRSFIAENDYRIVVIRSGSSWHVIGREILDT